MVITVLNIHFSPVAGLDNRVDVTEVQTEFLIHPPVADNVADDSGDGEDDHDDGHGVIEVYVVFK